MTYESKPSVVDAKAITAIAPAAKGALMLTLQPDTPGESHTAEHTPPRGRPAPAVGDYYVTPSGAHAPFVAPKKAFENAFVKLG